MRSPVRAETQVCVSCKETIYHPICASCLASSTYQWLETKSRSAKVAFSEFLPSLMRKVRGDSACVKCRGSSGICPYCFTEVVSRWLEKHAPRLSRDYLKVFNFDFDRAGYSVGRLFSTRLFPDARL